jgi:hypothetical protein
LTAMRPFPAPLSLADEYAGYVERNLLTSLALRQEDNGSISIYEITHNKRIITFTDKQLEDASYDMWAAIIRRLMYHGPNALETLGKIREEYCGGRF